MTDLNTKSLSCWLDYIARTHPQDIDMGLDRVRRVFDAMQLETKARQVVVVAGTNGKGSTIAMLEAGLSCSGLTVGSYTSPHIQTYNERVKVNRCPVSDQRLVEAFANVDQARKTAHENANEAIPLTYFEFGTLAAFDILFRQDLDVLLLEIGLGGRLDAVNIVDADLSIITSIALDHTDWLGESLDEIGREKAGILRPGVLALLGEHLPGSVYQRAHSIGAPVISVHQHFDRTSSGMFLFEEEKAVPYSYFPEMRLPENNILLALQALSVLGKRLGVPIFNNEAINECFEALNLSGRLEKLSGQDIYLDVGHNPHAAGYLHGFLCTQKQQGKTIHAVFSALADKDVSALVAILSPVVDCWFIAPMSEPRALDQKSLESAVGPQVKNMLSFDSIPEALHESLVISSKQSALTLVFGSFYVVEAAKNYFENL